MSERKKRKSEPPPPTRPSQRPSQRPSARPGSNRPEPSQKASIQAFFKRGAQFAEELLHDNERLRRANLGLEAENAALRTQLASDRAMRDLLRKIKQLEKEKLQLLSHVHEAQRESTRYSSRYSEMEEELSKLANVYVASYQLHSTLRLPLVIKHLQELLQQLVGASSHAIFMAEPNRRNLVLIASERVDRRRLGRLPLGGDDPVAPVVERAFLTGVPQITHGELAEAGEDAPAAVVPLHFDDRVMGVIVVYSVFEQKPRFVPVDFELFKMLGAHAASAIAGALLYAAAGSTLPGPEALQDLSA